MLKSLVLGTFICVAITGCEMPESTMSYESINQRDLACKARGGEQVLYMGKENPKSVVKSRCSINGVEYQFWYSRYRAGPQL